MDMPRNAFKHAIAAGKLQIGLWCSLCNPIAAEIVVALGLRLDAARHRAFAERSARHHVAVAGDPRRHRLGDRAAGLERHGDDQAHPRYRRADAAGAVRAERRGGAGARSRRRAIRRQASAASPAPARASRYGRVPDYLKNAAARSACWCRSRPAPRSIRLEAIAEVDGVDGVFIGPIRSLGLVRPYRQSGASRSAGRVEGRGEAAEKDRQAGRHPHAATRTRRRHYIDWGYTFVAVGADIGLLARNADALAKRFKS